MTSCVDGPAITLVDLATQYRRLKPVIAARIQTVLDHGRFILGPEVAELEARLAAFSGAGHCVTVASGTDALTIALMAEGVGPGDAVFLPAFTFTATAEVVALLGARPVFVDVDQRTFNLDPAALARSIADCVSRNLGRPRAVIAVDLFGQPADYPALGEIAAAHDLLLLADAAQSFGGALKGVLVGRLAPVTAASFFPAKPLGAYGDGGALLTDDADRAALYRSIRAHGKGGAKYDIQRIGLNSRLDTIQAAVLLAKLDIFPEELAARRAAAIRYSADLPPTVQTPGLADGAESAWAQYTITCDRRDDLAAALKDRGIPTAVYYPLPMHRQTAYARYGDGPGSLPVSEKLSSQVLSLPMHPYLDDSMIARVCAAVGLVTEA